MTSVTCLCDEESSDDVTCDNSCPSESVNDVNDFIQQLLCYKCKVVDLVKDQMQKSQCQQNNLLSKIDETRTDIDCTNLRHKRETSEGKGTEKETGSAPSYWLTSSLIKKLLYGFLIILLFIFTAWLTYSRILGSRVCAKGLCVPIPFGHCPPRPRIF